MVSSDLESREYNGRWYTDVAWKVSLMVIRTIELIRKTMRTKFPIIGVIQMMTFPFNNNFANILFLPFVCFQMVLQTIPANILGAKTLNILI